MKETVSVGGATCSTVRGEYSFSLWREERFWNVERLGISGMLNKYVRE